MTFGKILLINGPSSSGKTSIARALTNQGYITISSDSIKNEILYEYANINFKNELSLLRKNLEYDEVLKILYGFKLTQGKFSEKEIRFIQDFQKVFINSSDLLIYDEIEIYKRMYNLSKESIYSGRNIVLDLSIYGKNFVELELIFKKFPVVTIYSIYNSLEENLIKCFKRNFLSLQNSIADYRHPANVIDEYNNFYKFYPQNIIKKDVKIVDVIDTSKIKTILALAKKSQKNLLSQLRYKILGKGIYELLCKKRNFKNNIHVTMDNAIKHIENSINIHTQSEVNVQALVSHDFIIKSFSVLK